MENFAHYADWAYLIGAVLFILALRGLSSPASAIMGNRYGMIGMTIAVVTTLVTHMPMKAGDAFNSYVGPDFFSFGEILAAIAVAIIGYGVWLVAFSGRIECPNPYGLFCRATKRCAHGIGREQFKRASAAIQRSSAHFIAANLSRAGLRLPTTHMACG